MAGFIYKYLSAKEAKALPLKSGLADPMYLDANVQYADRAFVRRDETKLKSHPFFDTSFAGFIEEIFSEVDQPIFTMISKTRKFVLQGVFFHLVVRRLLLTGIIGYLSYGTYADAADSQSWFSKFYLDPILQLAVILSAAVVINWILARWFRISLDKTTPNLRVELVSYTTRVFGNYHECLKTLGTFRNLSEESDDRSQDNDEVITDKSWPNKSAKWTKVTLWHASRLEYIEWFINVNIWRIDFWWRGVGNKIAFAWDVGLLFVFLGLQYLYYHFLQPPSEAMEVILLNTLTGVVSILIFRLVGASKNNSFSDDILSPDAITWKTQEDLGLSRELADIVRGDRRAIMREEKKRQ